MKFLMCIVVLSGLVAFAAQAGKTGLTLVTASDLQADAELAEKRDLAILLAVTRDSCQYCDLLKREILIPMIKSGEYEDRVVIREMAIEPDYRLRDFHGRPRSSGSIAKDYQITITPTVLLLGPSGEKLHPSLVGINTVEMYGFYLDRAISASLAELKSDRQSSNNEEAK
jgi:thioredoxin-related protein